MPSQIYCIKDLNQHVHDILCDVRRLLTLTIFLKGSTLKNIFKEFHENMSSDSLHYNRYTKIKTRSFCKRLHLVKVIANQKH